MTEVDVGGLFVVVCAGGWELERYSWERRDDDFQPHDWEMVNMSGPELSRGTV